MASAVPILALHQGLPSLPAFGDVETACLQSLEAHLRDLPNPSLVLSPLFWRDGDVMEVARLLWTLDYAGPYRVFSAPLPCPAVVETEVLAAFPGLDFALLTLKSG